MSIKIICGYNDAEWDSVSDMFYENFNPDDWDYIIIGEDQHQVEDMAYRLQVCGCEVKSIKMVDPMTNWTVDQWVAVTYHG